MPKVFVHGNPECSAVWDLLVAELADRSVDDVVRLSPPGFGAPVPDGFEATMAGYHAWLVAELEAIDGPIDLVGHDWGTGHVAGIAADRPDLIRSFASVQATARSAASCRHHRAARRSRPPQKRSR